MRPDLQMEMMPVASLAPYAAYARMHPSEQVAQVRAGFVPQPEAVGAFGYDFRQVVEMIREANALLDDAGLSLDSDPRRVAKSGAAQDAAQLAAIEIAATGAAAPRADPAAT